jgi:two-component system, NarL family, invasion response regulator UvrY
VIRVLMADDHAIVRQGLKHILSDAPDIRVTAEAEDGLQVIRLTREQNFDVAILDVSMPHKNGMDVLKQLKSEFPKLPVLILSMHAEDQLAVRMLKLGASGYLSKQSAPGQLVTAIRQVAAGKRYISAQMAEQLAASVLGDGETKPHEALSAREYQTLCMIASGKGLTEMAQELKLSAKTVSVYRARVLEKLSLKNNSEITHYAIKHHLIDPI